MNTLIIAEAVLIIKDEATAQLRISAVLLRKAGRWNMPYAEFGVGVRNQMIKAPFMKLAYSESEAFYITFNKGELYIPVQLKNKALGIDGDLSIILPKLLEKMKQSKNG